MILVPCLLIWLPGANLQIQVHNVLRGKMMEKVKFVPAEECFTYQMKIIILLAIILRYN